MNDTPDVVVTAIQFAGEVINIQYLERRKQSEYGGVMESATYEIVYIEDDVEELQQNAVDLVDVILRLIAQPPTKKRGEGLRMMREVDDLLTKGDDNED